jgi:hypothetical protein
MFAMDTFFRKMPRVCFSKLSNVSILGAFIPIPGSGIKLIVDALDNIAVGEVQGDGDPNEQERVNAGWKETSKTERIPQHRIRQLLHVISIQKYLNLENEMNSSKDVWY